MKSFLREYGLLALAILGMACLAVVGFVSLNQQSSQASSTFIEGIDLSQKIGKIDGEVKELSGILRSVPATLDLVQLGEMETNQQKLVKLIEEHLVAVEKTGLNSEGTKLALQELVQPSEKLFQLANLFAQAQANTLLAEIINPALKKLTNELATLNDAAMDLTNSELDQLKYKAMFIGLFMIAIAVGLMAIVVILGGYLSVQQARRQRGSKLLLEEVQVVLEDVNTDAHSMAAQTTQLASGADNTFELVHSVSSAVEETTASLESLSAAVEELSATSSQIKGQVEESQASSQSAVHAAHATADSVSSLTEAVEKISSVIELINAISEKTNLLSLNAAIEAARAGESGRGFAVVADEVSKLAKQTNQATKQIEQQIETIKSVSADVSQSIHITETTITSMGEIADSVTLAVTEQSQVTHDIASSISQVTAAAGQIADDMRQVNIAAESVQHTSDSSSKMVQQTQQQIVLLGTKLGDFLKRLG